MSELPRPFKVRVYSKGQLYIPKTIREMLGLKPGARLEGRIRFEDSRILLVIEVPRNAQLE